MQTINTKCLLSSFLLKFNLLNQHNTDLVYIFFKSAFLNFIYFFLTYANYLNKNGFLFKTKLLYIVVILIFMKFFTKLYIFNSFDF